VEGIVEEGKDALEKDKEARRSQAAPGLKKRAS
jgi:hypothetical protein